MYPRADVHAVVLVLVAVFHVQAFHQAFNSLFRQRVAFTAEHECKSNVPEPCAVFSFPTAFAKNVRDVFGNGFRRFLAIVAKKLFGVDGNVSKIEINIRTMEVQGVGTLVNVTTGERISLRSDMYTIGEGRWRVEASEGYEVEVKVYSNKAGSPESYGSEEFEVDVRVSKVEIRIEEK